MSSESRTHDFALPTPKFLLVRPPDHSVWNLLDMPPALSHVQDVASFPFPPDPPEPLSPANSSQPEPVLPSSPLPASRASGECSLLANHGGVAGPVVEEGERGDKGERDDAREDPLNGDRLDELMEDFLDHDTGSECSHAHVSQAAWYARADARNGSGDLSRASASTSFELVSDTGPRSGLAGDSALQAKESFEPLPIWLASREADLDYSCVEGEEPELLEFYASGVMSEEAGFAPADARSAVESVFTC